MEFATPRYLSFFVLIPLLAVLLLWAAYRRRKALTRIGEVKLLAALTASLIPHRRRIKHTLWLAAAAAVILSLGRPLWGVQTSVKARQGVAVMVVLDVSQSMLAEDILPSRLDRARLTVEQVMERLGGNDIGLVIFSGSAFLQFPLTSDFNTALTYLYNASPDSISRSGTAIEKAINVALDSFPEHRATGRIILLLTDGEGHEGSPLTAAQNAAQDGVIIHTIGLGSADGEPIPLRNSDGTIAGYKTDRQGEIVLSRLDETTLQEIASRTGGIYARADSLVGVESIIEAISAIETLQEEQQFETSSIERHPWFTGLALAALMLEVLIHERRSRA
jgi:Ca-activated chloride channel homolog